VNCRSAHAALVALLFLGTFTGKHAGAQIPRANRLAKETSPYLVQHAHNPVDWYPWGEEALKRARDENKPIFLSIGYSSCHWCHVMEHESFTDEQIARYMNDHFVCIKVDREERPDIDSIYMTSVQLMTQRGGWPLSIFLTPDGSPFFGATYLPARDGDRGTATGFLTILQRIQNAWRNDRGNIDARSKAVANAVRQNLAGDADSPELKLSTQIAQRSIDHLATRFDADFGGFGYSATNPQTPKFPQAPVLRWLLNRAEEGDGKAFTMLTLTLDHLARGGMRDHVGGGFHRYCVDRYWHIPHFEKMLYDNGQLLSIYAGASQLPGIDSQRRAEYERVVEETVTFLDREMTSPEGAYYSALDADSEGEEGKYYVWTKSEWLAALGQEKARLFESVYAAQHEPNFEGKFYYPQLSVNRDDAAVGQSMSVDALEAQLRPMRETLLARRAERKRPLTDTKILTSWNGLMIRGLADAGRLLDRPEAIQRAAKAADFVLDNLRDADGHLSRTYSAGRARLNAYLDDYAFLVDGLIGLHLATGDARWLEAAGSLTEKQIDLFWDDALGGFFFTSKDHEQLIVRGKQVHGGPRPSGAAVAASNLVYLATAWNRPAYLDRAQQTINSASRQLNRYPSETPRMVQALSEWLDTTGDE
jgi:uncharacterized protein YyaL (SSP411 family)